MKRKGFLGGIFTMALILVLTLVLSVGSVSAAEPTIVDSGNCGKDGNNVTWTLDSAGLLTISGTGEMADYESKTDSASGEEITTAPWGNQAKTAVIGDGVTGIGNAAFYGCSGLTSVTMGSNVTSIGESAFCGCTGLTGIVLPGSVTGIGEYAFSNCESLTAIEIPAGVTTLGNSAFFGCDNLKEVRYNARAAANLTGLSGAFRSAGASVGGVKVIFGESVEKIPSNLFCNCESLTSVTIGSNVTSIGDNAFLDCKGLVEINYNARAAECTEDSFGSGDGLKVTFGDSVERIPDYIFQDCPGLTSVTIGGSATTIGHYAFNRCTGLTSIKIPESMTNIGYMAFSGCTGLADVYYGGSERQWNAITIDDGNDRLLQANRHCEGKETLVSPTAKPSYVGASGKPYIYWSAVDGANRYYVYRSTTKDGTYSFLDSTANLNYTDSKANAGTTYYYKVKALAADGTDSSLSAAVAITCRCARPVVKTDYWASTGKPYIKWTAVAGASQYEVYRSGSKDGTYTLLGTTTATNYTDSKANAGYTYYYKVKAISEVKSAANSSLSAAVAITCRCARPVVTPDYLTSTGKPYIKWAAVAGASQYEVYRSGSSNGTYEYVGTTTATNYTDSKANAGYTYYYRVKAISKVRSTANSSLSAAVAITCRCARPVVKTDYWASTGKPYIKWTAVAGASQYEVYRSGSKDGTYTLLGTTTATNYTDSKANAGYTYYYKVKAISEVKSAANSSLSAAVAITCRCARPVVTPDYLTSTGKPYIKWAAVAGASQYEVYRSGSSNGTYEYVGTTTATNYTDSKANAGYTYYYRVKAISKVRSTANSSLSAAVAITCRCARPVVKTDYWASTGKPYIKWDAVDGAGKYYIYRSGTRNGTYTLLGTTTATNYTDSKANAGYTYYYKVQAISSALTMAKVYLSPSNQTDNCYAYGNTNEAVQCGKIADSCRIALERSGVTVQVGHMPSMQDKCKESNAFGADLHVPIHTNAFDGTVTGTRMFCLNSSGEGMKACEAIFAWLAPITPGTSENIQVDASLYEVRVPSAPTAYVECEFHDNAITAKWIVEHTVDIGEAIARGICDYFGVTYKEKEQPESAASTDKLYRVQEGAFANRPIAEEKNTANSSLSATVAATCHCARPVVKPDYLISTGKPYIKWTAVAGASKYYVYRSGSSNGTYKYVGTTTATNYTDNKANAGYTYYYKVKAVSKVSSGANSYYSVVIGATCHCARPSVKITTSNGSPRLTWNAVTGAAKYEVYRATSKNGSYTKMFTTSNLSYTNTSAKAGTTYYYKVKAVSKVKSTANSAFSTVVSIRAR